ncbi:HEAT repeat domain-containing protein [Armatimonas rosea]|uniref:HEAT repeat protein n=1 Tax=Armatimonas rosea TaxID=685828 RepID=A0A7W9STP4_ARMRO|nr:HEAT repeat domain-containing protein [Armatimonas rosea]MBB6052118.1 HEAT repeat protein [Armatimonas rosea]
MSMDVSPTGTKFTPRKVLGGALLALIGFGVINFGIQTYFTRSQLGLVASKDASSQEQGVTQLMGRKVLFDALQGGAPPETRLAAIVTLQKMSDGGKNKDAFEQLLQMCKDPDTESAEKKTHPVRDAARAAVAAVGATYAERLLDAAKDPDSNIRDGARDALKKIGAPLKEQMAKRLSDGGLRGPIGDILTSIGPDTIPLIVPYLTDEKIKDDAGAKITLIETLGKFKVAEAATPLLPFIDDKDPNVRRAVITSLANIGDPVGAPVLIQALSSPDTDASARAAAAGALGGIGTPEANAAMLKALSDYDTFVGVAAAAGLRRAGGSATTQLAQALTDPSPWVRSLAAEAAGGQRTATLATKALTDSDPAVRAKAAAALGDVLFRAAGIRQALAALASAADDKARDAAVTDLIRFGAEQETNAVGAPPAAKTSLIAYYTAKRDAEKDDKKKAPWDKKIAALSAPSLAPALAQPTEFLPLITALSDKEGASEAAAIALGRLGTVAVEALKAKLGSGDDTLAYYASKALATVGRDAVPGLLPLATEGNPAARWAAITLGEIRDPKAASALEALTKSASEDTAFVAQAALSKVKPG